MKVTSTQKQNGKLHGKANWNVASSLLDTSMSTITVTDKVATPVHLESR